MLKPLLRRREQEVLEDRRERTGHRSLGYLSVAAGRSNVYLAPGAWRCRGVEPRRHGDEDRNRSRRRRTLGDPRGPRVQPDSRAQCHRPRCRRPRRARCRHYPRAARAVSQNPFVVARPQFAAAAEPAPDTRSGDDPTRATDSVRPVRERHREPPQRVTHHLRRWTRACPARC